MATDNTPPEGVKGTAGSFWNCKFCGNVVYRRERPSKCYNCRPGENDYGETHLYTEIEIEP